ncbi:DEAD/DEAH box helicase [Canibacter zhoujuaniae]|uniref:DEAD/DEAH box helicase n=1 Tax=Canibacter zhoujuaniae TaxID=2708343 RepID=UPI00141E0D3C|nr:DEAD/DEAH box helicase [Canibacter zhoujuaniae]
MSRKAKRGFKAPKNYDPNRGKKKPHRKGLSARAATERGEGADRGYSRDKRRPERNLGERHDKKRGYSQDRHFAGDRRDDRGEGRPLGRRGDRRDRDFVRGARDNARRDEGRAFDRRERDYDRRDDRRDFGRRENRSGDRRDFRAERRFNDRAERGSKKFGRDNARQGFQPPEDIVLEKLAAIETSAADVEGVAFADLGLGDRLVSALADMGAVSPFAIQVATIPDVIAGRDVLGRGRTGSGKTIAFGAGLVERLLQLKSEGLFDNDPRPPKRERGKRTPMQQGRFPKALILAPTRELALQIDRTVQPLARAAGLFTTQLVGGAPIERQQHALLRGIDIAIGTPGRVEDLIERGNLNIGQVAIAVLDEADHMAELGFIEPVQRILRQTAPGSQKLLFSATLDAQVTKLVKEFLVEPSVHEVADEKQGSLDHHVLVVLREDKNDVLTEIIEQGGDRTIVFTRTRAYAETLRELFEDSGISAVDLHGNLSQSRRERNLKRFTDGKVGVLVATDVAARGIHVDDVKLVVQADPPDDYKAYLHRSGRTGRAGRNGIVVTVIPRNRQKRTRQLFENAQLRPEYFGDFAPGQAQDWLV